jgi:hypothetical protein
VASGVGAFEEEAFVGRAGEFAPLGERLRGHGSATDEHR